MVDGKFLENNLSESVFLYGSGRSGTTWLEERIANAINAEVIFEPLKGGLCDIADKYGYKYLPTLQNSDDLQMYITSLISGDIKFFWTRYRILPERLVPNFQVIANKAEFKAWVKRFSGAYRLLVRYRPTINRPRKIIKLIRANLMVDWFVKTFSGSLHIAITRHPAAVIESRMRLDRLALGAGIARGANDWDAKALVNQYVHHQLPKKLKKTVNEVGPINKLQSYEYHCLLWCIENKLFFDRKNMFSQLIYYEDLIDKKSQSWSILAGVLNTNENKLTHNMEIPSQQASNSSNILSQKSPYSSIEKLKSIEGDSCIEKLQEYLDLFDIRQYKADSLSPES